MWSFLTRRVPPPPPAPPGPLPHVAVDIPLPDSPKPFPRKDVIAPSVRVQDMAAHEARERMTPRERAEALHKKIQSDHNKLVALARHWGH